ncbi:MAG: hypothetical protein HWQ23_00075, partial [Nostoc sp. JL33]|uniref:hypothetical protein n=1 Tax=Nostoc sp. JL33 TaxID=2815396 RepID=UPI0025D4702E
PFLEGKGGQPVQNLLQVTRIHPIDAIADFFDLLALGRQVVVRLQVLQPNGVLTIPGFNGAAKLTHMVDYPPATTFAPKFGIILG